MRRSLLLAVWREACRHIELAASLDRIAALLGAHVPADVLLVRRFDLERSQIETVATSICRAGPSPSASLRTSCSPRSMGDVLAWAREGTLLRGRMPAEGSVLAVVAPDDVRGHCLAGPLIVERGPTGVLVAISTGQRFSAAHERLVGGLLEPVSIALDNHWRLLELARLRAALEADKQALLSRLDRQDVSDSIVGMNTGLREVMERVEQVAPTDAPVLVVGETGTGKEVVARAIHSRSHRARGPIVRVNCGAIPAGLIDSELFGHERGSFTGAIATRQGWFERADGGTLFLDEIGELPAEAQVRLLRILQDGTFERVGGQRVLTVDVRIVAATHRELQEMVAQGSFREDLWYRIGVFPIHLPPLRDRLEDVPMLATHFSARAGHRLRGRTLVPSARDVDLLLRYPWPGNVRELAAVIERAAILGGGTELRIAEALGLPTPAQGGRLQQIAEPLREPMEPLEHAMRQHAEAALRWTYGRVDGRGGAAELLRVNPQTLRARLRKLGIDTGAYRDAASPGDDPGRTAASPMPWNAAMHQHIELALKRCAGRIEGPRGAAALLGINPHTLRARMRRLGMDWAQFRRDRAPLSGSVLM